MSVKETMRRIQETADAQREFHDSKTKEAEEKAKAAREERYKAEVPEATKVEAELLEELRQVGIIPLLEEMTGPIPPIPIESKGHDDTPESWRELQDELLESFDSVQRMFSGKWTAFVLPPEMKGDGSAKPDLRIEVRRVRVEAPRPNMSSNFTPPTLSVDLKYSQNRRLTIEGKHIIFNEKIQDSTHTQTDYEEALAKAFLEPKFEWSK